jgi:hypothetical protein
MMLILYLLHPRGKVVVAWRANKQSRRSSACGWVQPTTNQLRKIFTKSNGSIKNWKMIYSRSMYLVMAHKYL